MNKAFNIKLVNIVKRPLKGNNILITLLGILLLVIIGLLVLLIGIPTAGVSHLFRKLFPSKNATSLYKPDDEWMRLAQTKDLNIFMRYEGDAFIDQQHAYYTLKAEPEIPDLQGKYFNEFIFSAEGGIFLQQWNKVDEPDTNLIFIDTSTLEMTTLLVNIPSAKWLLKIVDSVLLLTYRDGDNELQYEINFK